LRALFGVGVLGAVACALCCVGILTPVLVAGLVAAGLGAWTADLDLVLFGGIVVFGVFAWIGWTRMNSARKPAGAAGANPSELTGPP
jgi:hypothetical protein